MRYKIYRLLDNELVVYIGRTKNTLSIRKNGGYGKNTEYFKECKIELIEETDDVSRERYWIEYYISLGIKLLNIKKGDGFNQKNYYSENKEWFKNYYKKWNENNTEKVKDYYKGYSKDKYFNNINNIKISQNKYYNKNKDDIVNKQLEYQEKHKEELKEYRKNYYKNYKKGENTL